MCLYARTDQFLSLCPLGLRAFSCHTLKTTVISSPLKKKIWVPPPSLHNYLNLNPHLSNIGRVFCSDICPCCVSLLDLSSVCVSIIFFCLWLLAYGDCVCGACVYFTVRGRGGPPPTWGMLWKCHCLVVLRLMTQFIQRWWFFCSPQRGLLLCLPGIRNGK